MESPRPTTPVPDDCPVCLEPMRSGYARVDWCLRHPLCRECADRIYSGGDHRCPMCRQAWFHEEPPLVSDFIPVGYNYDDPPDEPSSPATDPYDPEDDPMEDMLWEPDGLRDYPDPYVVQWVEENGDDVPMYVRSYNLSY